MKNFLLAMMLVAALVFFGALICVDIKNNMPVSTVSGLNCEFIAKIKVDSKIGSESESYIVGAANKWHQASWGKICFVIIKIDVKKIENSALCKTAKFNPCSNEIYLLELNRSHYAAMHVIGHIIGLNHSKDFNSIMYDCANFTSKLSRSDRDNLNKIISNKIVFKKPKVCKHDKSRWTCGRYKCERNTTGIL